MKILNPYNWPSYAKSVGLGVLAAAAFVQSGSLSPMRAQITKNDLSNVPPNFSPENSVIPMQEDASTRAKRAYYYHETREAVCQRRAAGASSSANYVEKIVNEEADVLSRINTLKALSQQLAQMKRCGTNPNAIHADQALSSAIKKIIEKIDYVCSSTTDPQIKKICEKELSEVLVKDATGSIDYAKTIKNLHEIGELVLAQADRDQNLAELKAIGIVIAGIIGTIALCFGTPILYCAIKDNCCRPRHQYDPVYVD